MGDFLIIKSAFSTVITHKSPLLTSVELVRREYKTICRTDSVFNGQFTPHLLSKVLNAHARQGWRVVSSNTAPSYAADGTEYQEFFVLLERG